VFLVRATLSPIVKIVLSSSINTSKAPRDFAETSPSVPKHALLNFSERLIGTKLTMSHKRRALPSRSTSLPTPISPHQNTMFPQRASPSFPPYSPELRLQILSDIFTSTIVPIVWPTPYKPLSPPGGHPLYSPLFRNSTPCSRELFPLLRTIAGIRTHVF
jgi:hypothetical protein